jgi:branched-chain amino acid transport system ATP-binding protein
LIKAEHRAIAGMLSAMQALVVRYRGVGSRQDFTLFEAMLAYVENVPDQVHHPKEDAVLFPPLVRRTKQGKQLVDELERDHARGRAMRAALHDALRACRDGAIEGLDRLGLGVDEFAEFHVEHMRKEEEELLPLALTHLTVDEWQCVERAFGDATDPRFSADLAGDYRRLYQCIAEQMPPPLGSYLASPMPRSTGS